MFPTSFFILLRPYHHHLRKMTGMKCHKTDIGAYITLHSPLYVRRLCRVPDLRDIIAQKQVTLAGSVYRRRDLPEELATWMYATRDMEGTNARGEQRQVWLKQAEDHMARMGLVWEDAYDLDRWTSNAQPKFRRPCQGMRTTREILTSSVTIGRRQNGTETPAT